MVSSATTNDCLSPISCCIGRGGGLALFDEPKTDKYQFPDNDDTDNDDEKPKVASARTVDTADALVVTSVPTSESLWSWLSSNVAAKELPTVEGVPTLLPILIIPGFMSSGLEIQQSKVRPEWQGKRLWINLGSLGMSSLYFGGAQQQQKQRPKKESRRKLDDIKQAQQHQYKSMWLEHMRLNDKDLRTEPAGIRVRPIQGLEGVDYLSPGAFTNHVSYVFGPVIQALKSAGYQEEINLKAAPYDWRLPPVELESRDQYFTKTLQQVEDLYQQSHDTPVVLLGHSLGTKTAHYFLNFCLAKKGQAWIDQRIHTYMPVGAPHLGAPKALRSVVAGDKMGLDAFLNAEEALALGRSFGSGPWLFPSELPPGVPASVYVLPHGILDIRFDGFVVDTNPLVHKRTAMTKPNRYQLMVEMTQRRLPGQPSSSHNRTVSTSFCNTVTGKDQVMFTDKISFATHENPKTASQARIRFYLQEPGIAAAKQEKEEPYCNPIMCFLKWITCCCVCDYLYRLVRWITCGLVRGLALSADAITGVGGVSSNLAFSEYFVIPHEVWTNGGKEIEKTVTLNHKDDYGATDHFFCFSWLKRPRTAKLSVRIRWTPSEGRTKSVQRVIGSAVCQPSEDTPSGIAITKNDQIYQEFAGHDILEREGLDTTLQLIHSAYDRDATIGPRDKSSRDAPPVKRVHAIYGINVPTEVGAIYKRKDNCLAESRLDNLYKLDARARVDAKSGYTSKGGLLFETSKTRQYVADGRKVCGDGTVPYWSLQHCHTWKSSTCDVSVVELQKAEHREILADSRFHKAILEYCRIPKETA
ncbi:Phospholipid:diacylglycerol acyltransferase [Seminavis robusta]|uniref:Phospholipid:diacylglycerol acyltransferase n=1 Tax=Seminavis robusta TaxID=568900 RepID=A0A9N8DXK5_9STRA|nr:Phospholipid:diacylglycerol acyltransferase [Seminavis robusta]|eukprot:Sro431_g141480.1 Phospholipid:diacylglycerol acyltransferase (810) ;mRNA; r:44028-46457